MKICVVIYCTQSHKAYIFEHCNKFWSNSRDIYKVPPLMWPIIVVHNLMYLSKIYFCKAHKLHMPDYSKNINKVHTQFSLYTKIQLHISLPLENGPITSL